MKEEAKESVKEYTKEIADLIKKALASKPVKCCIAGAVVGIATGSVLGVPVIGLYIGAGVGAYQGITS